jgi:hypothetical protein
MCRRSPRRAATLVLAAETNAPALGVPGGASFYRPAPSFKPRVPDSYLPPQLKSINDRFEALDLK